MVFGRLNNSAATAVLQPPLIYIYIYIYIILFLTISNYYMYIEFKLYVHKLQTKRGKTMIIHESKMEENIKTYYL